MANKGVAALRQFTRCKGKTGGRNSQGRITAFHRGGGAKQLLRKIDLKRSNPGVGIVERIEYDPNRSSKIALVRWIEGETPPRCQRERSAAGEEQSASLPKKILESTTATTDGGRFSFSTLPGRVDQTPIKSIINSALSPSAISAKGTAAHSFPFDGLRGLPRIAVAGAKPSFFASHMKEEPIGETIPLRKIQEWRPDRQIWIHRMKRKAAISWQSLRKHSTLAAAGAPACEESKPKVDRGW
ncbi:unnamed protein product [Spirodela intermedia]|uniref:60S ribosomal protein L2, mitochondrial n=1 Tax=Spirodela intermedia TaxID=51605 RepID=A0A7I8KCN0_SPIIN|nr:unnamed protein product [Spirodela intermedia]